MATIVTKNSSTASAVPTTSDLVQGELAVNVTDKRIFTENASTQIVELGTNPSSITTATATVTGTLTANGTFASSNAVITGGSINSTPIGATTPSTVKGSTVTATTGFVGGLTGNVTGNLTGNVTGNVNGNLTGNVTGNVTASSGTTTLNDLVVNGTADFTNTKLTNITTPTASSDAANKGYVDSTVAAVIDSAPAALDTLNELAAALGDDANFAGTVTTALATKLPLAGGTMTGAIAMGTSKITGLGNPTSAQDAATKTYVDTADALKLNLTGGTMSGAIAMGTNKITGVGDPTLAQDAATKAYTDSILGSATSAATSAAAAATSASNAATSASNAATSATASANSASAAAASYDAFDDRYLGDKASDPTLDNDGNALLTGALYFNTTSDDMKVYDGSAWNIAAISSASPTFTGTVTADGLTVEDGGTIQLTKNTVSAGDSLGIIEFHDEDGTATADAGKFQLQAFRGADKDAPDFKLIGSDAGGTLRTRLQIENNGDISFYEDTGTTAKLTWDASAESLNFADNAKATFGAGNDLQIYHDGASSTSYFIESNATGNMEFRASSLRLKEGDGGNYYFLGVAGGASTVYHNGSAKLATTATGIDVTGTATMDGLTVDGASQFNTGAGGVAEFYHSSGLGGLRVTGAASGSASTIFLSNDKVGTPFDIYSFWGNGADDSLEFFSGGTPSTGTKRLKLASNGDISFYEDTGTTPKFFWDASAEALGIGTTSPSQKLHIADSGNAVVLIEAGNTSGSYINFADTDDTNIGQIQYDHSSNFMAFRTNDGERLRIDSSGNLLVGKTGAGTNTAGSQIDSTGRANFTVAANFGLLVNRLTSDGELARFQKDGTTVGSIGTNSNIYLVGTSSGLRIRANDIIPVDATGAGNDNALDLGIASQRWKDLYLSGGVYLGGTGAANLLDDYEEGTYTAAITCGTSGTITLNAGYDTASYTKIGDLVSVQGLLIIGSVSSPVGYFKISLPFTPRSLTDRAGDSAGSILVHGSSANVRDFCMFVAEPDGAFAYVYLGDATTRQEDSANALNANDQITFQVSYKAA
jgi:hypothetical protein